ncbi:CoA-dependent acyltransferase [Russula emetica]|nr:CoA-dependent acyltransferase [Russula emetica]
MILLRQTRCALGRRRHVAHLHVLQRFKLADIGEGITECEVIKWSVSPRSSVSIFDPLCEVQSDKASVEITSPYDGTVAEILVQEGQVAKVGEDLCLIEVDEEESNPSCDTPHKHESGPPPPSDKQPVARRLHPLDPNASPQSASESRRASTWQQSGASSDSVTVTAAKRVAVDILALPGVRHFARESGVDIALLAPGSGKNGRVERVDVKRYLAGGKSGSVGEQPTAVSPSPLAEDDIVVELGRTRYGIKPPSCYFCTAKMHLFSYSTSLDLTALHDLLPILNTNIPQHYLPPSRQPTAPQLISPSSFFAAPTVPAPPVTGTYDKLTYLPILLKTLSKAMHSWPLFRSSITPGSVSNNGSKPTMTLRPHSDICIALSTPTGLYTPTVRAVDTHSVYSLAATLKHLAYLGRQVPCGLTPAELPRRGGTLTVSNIGAIGAGESAMPLLVPGGGVAIVALGRARWEWDVERGDGKGERRLKVGVSWSADHRVVEGAELAAQPERMIAEGV